MMKVLVVTREFGDYQRGSVIVEKGEQDKVLETHAGHVVQAEHPDSKE